MTDASGFTITIRRGDDGTWRCDIRERLKRRKWRHIAFCASHIAEHAMQNASAIVLGRMFAVEEREDEAADAAEASNQT